MSGLTATEKVVGNPEMLDHIYTFLDLKSLVRARCVSWQWRQVSDMSLKRRVKVVEEEQLFEFRKQDCEIDIFMYRRRANASRVGAEALYLKLREYEKQRKGSFKDGEALSLQDVELIIEDPTERCECKLKGVCIASPDARPVPFFLATALNLGWLPAVTTLELEKCMTLEDWASVGMHILQGFPSVADLRLELSSDLAKDQCTPLCYQELKTGGDLADAKFEALEKLYVACLLMEEINDAGFDIVKRAPNLKDFLVRYQLQSGNRLTARLYPNEDTEGLKFDVVKYEQKPVYSGKGCECPDTVDKSFQEETIRFVDSALQSLHEDVIFRVTSVCMDQCITATQWAASGISILQKFPTVQNVSVDLNSIPSPNEQFWEPLMHHAKNGSEELKFSSVEAITITYDCTACTCEISGKHNHPKARRVCYDVLKLCPNLKVLNSFVRFRGCYCWDYSRCRIKANKDDTPGSNWKLEMGIWIDRKDGTIYSNPVLGDVAVILQIIEPKEVSSITELYFACAINPSALASVETLVVKNWFLVPVQTGRPLRGANTGEAFQNLKKLIWAGESYGYCYANAELDIAAGLTTGLAFENVTTLDMVHWKTALIDAELQHTLNEIYPHIHEMVPNVQVLVVGFISDEDSVWSSVPYSLTNTLQLVGSFDNKLKHLVLVSKLDSRNCRDLEIEEFEYFIGLSSVTVIVQWPPYMKLYTIIFGNMCAQIPTIRKLGVYTEERQNSEGQPMPVEEVDLAILDECDVKIPKHLTIETGSRNLLHGKAVFEGIEDSYLKWEDVKHCNLPEPQVEDGDEEWLAALDDREREDSDMESDDDMHLDQLFDD